MTEPAPRTLPLLAAANFAAAVAGMIIAGILQLIARDLSWSPTEAGRLITTYALGFAIGAPLLGAWLAETCRKVIVVRGLALIAVGSVGSALATSSPWLELSRLVVAAGSALTIPSVSAITAYLFPTTRTRALAIVLAGMSLATVLGLPAGTFLAGEWGWHAPLFAAAGVAMLAAIAIKRYLPGGIIVPPVPLRAWGALLRNPRAYVLLGPTVLFMAATFVVYAYIAPFLSMAVGADARALSWLLLWFGLVSLGASTVLGRLERRFGANRLLLASAACLAGTMALLTLTADVHALVVVLFASWAITSSFFGTLQQARLIGAAPEASSAVLALNTSATFAGQAIGAVLGGIVIQIAGVPQLPWVGAALAVLALAVLARSRDTRIAVEPSAA